MSSYPICQYCGEYTHQCRCAAARLENENGQCRPTIIFGEQVAGAAGRLWIAGVSADLEAAGYRTAAPNLDAEALATFERIRVLARERRQAYGRRVRRAKDTVRPSKAFPIYNPADRD